MPPTPDTFDYIVVGGGSAGSVIANRLSADGQRSVCLIEAGGNTDHMLVRAPMGAVAMMPAHLGIKINNWAFQTVPQPGLNGRRGYQPRGKGLGGSSIMNAMIYIRGNRRDYNNWADRGCDGWGYDDLLPLFRRAENFIGGADDIHGGDGPLHVTNLASPHAVTADFVKAGEATQLPRNDDFNGPDQYGIGPYHVTQFHDHRRGERCSAAAAYLNPVRSRPNLDIRTKTTALRIIMEDGRATGLAVQTRAGKSVISCRREIILSAGAFQSPQLLMLSGIGEGDHLRAMDIPVAIHSPDVGQNLQDHIDVTLSYGVNRTDVIGIGLAGTARLLRGIRQWRRDGTGPVSTNFAEAGAFFSVRDGGRDWPDTQLHFVVARVEDHARRLRWGYGVSCHACVLRPHSRGEVRLTSPHATDAPLIDPRFLEDERDLTQLKLAARKTHDIMTTAPMRDHITKSFTMPDNASDTELEQVIRNHADTVYHPVGTCRMGADAQSVVDPQLRVRGVDGLRVADASIMPRIVSGNTNAPAIMIGEKLSDLVLHG